MFPGPAGAEMPVSRCSEECPEGEAKIYYGDNRCCWDCHTCGIYQIMNPDNDTLCSDCPPGSLPDSLKKQQCVELPLVEHSFF